MVKAALHIKSLGGDNRRGEYNEKRTGQRDANWADWYAGYMVRAQAGQPLPQ